MHLLMCHPLETTRPRASDISAAIGAAVWVGSLIGVRPDWTGALFLLAPLVLVPLAMGLISPPSGNHLAAAAWRAATLLQPWAAALLVPAFALTQGAAAGLLAMPWCIVTALLALVGLIRLTTRGRVDLVEHAFDAALLFIAVGGTFTVITRLGLRPMGFEPIIIALTAVHFHYAGFILPLASGLVARALPGAASRLGVVLCVVGVPLLAVGMTFWPIAEIVAVAFVTLGGGLVALGHFQLAARSKHATALTLWGISGVSMLGGMILAGVFGLGRFLGLAWIDIPAMLPTHGALNALGFALCGLLAWRIYCPAVALRCR